MPHRSVAGKLAHHGADVAQGLALGLHRKLVKPVLHRAADFIIPDALNESMAGPARNAPEKGPQFDLKHQGVYGIGGRWPQIHPTHDLYVAGSNLKRAVNLKASRLPETSMVKRMVNKLGIGRTDKRDLASTEGAYRTPKREYMSRLPKLKVKKGRVEVVPRHLGKLSSPQRKLQRARAQALQKRLEIPGDRVMAAVAHPQSGGTLITYKSDLQRWAGSLGEHLPAPILGIIGSPSADAGQLKPPPLGMMTGIATQRAAERGGDPGLWRVDQGKLYQWREAANPRDGEAWQRQEGVDQARGVGLEVDGKVYVREDDRLSRLDAQGTLRPLFGDLAGYRSVHMLPASASVAPNAVAADHDGNLHLLAHGAKPVHLARIPGAKDAVPGPDGKSLFVLTQQGEIHALQVGAEGQLTRAGAQPLEALARQLPLEIGQSWRASALGFEPAADGKSVHLHALVGTERGEHRVSMVHDAASGEWQAQFKADGGLLVSEKGLESPVLKRGSETRFDERTSVAINEASELSVRLPGRNRWERLEQPDGRPVDGIQKVVTNVHGLTMGKALYAIREADGETAVHRLDVGGRVKVLQNQANPEAWRAPVPAVLAPDRLTASLGEPIARAVSAAPRDRIVDLSADNAGNVIHLSQAGMVTLTTTQQVGSQIGWPAMFSPVKGESVSKVLPTPVIDGQLQRVTQVLLSSDQGRVRALAEPRGVPDASPRLLEFEPAPAVAGEPAPPHLDGSWDDVHAANPTASRLAGKWVDLQLEWTNKRGEEMPDEDKRTARLSTSLWGTDIVEVGRHVAPDAPAERYRILNLPSKSAAEGSPSAATAVLRSLRNSAVAAADVGADGEAAPVRERFKLNSVSFSPEDPVGGMNANDALRLPVGFTKKTNVKFSLAGQKQTVNPFADVLPLGSTVAEVAVHVKDMAVSVAKGTARGLYNQLVSPLKVAPRMVIEWKKDVMGRPELKPEYTSVRQAYLTLDALPLPLAAPLARSLERRQLAPPAEMYGRVREQADAAVKNALDVCVDALQTMCVTARILEPDLVTERSRGPRRNIMKRLAVNKWRSGSGNRNVLPKVDAWWSKARETKVAYGDAEIGQIDKIERYLGLLKKNDVKLWDGMRGEHFASYHGSHAVQGAALATAMGHFAEAVELRTIGHTAESPFLPPGDEVAAAATTQGRLDALAKKQDSDMVLRLAKKELSGWEALEGASEVREAMNRELRRRGTKLTPGSKLYQMIKKDFQIPDAKRLPKEEFIALVSAKWNEMINSLGPRSTYFWLTRKDLGLGLVANTGFDAIAGGASVLAATGFRREGMGVETLGTGDGVGQGPQIWFWPRAQGANIAASQSLGIIPPKHQGDGLWGGGVRAELSGMSSTFKGMASIIDPRDAVRHIKTILNPEKSMLDVAEMSIKGNSIALAGMENQMTATAGAVGILNMKETRHAHTWGKDGKYGFNSVLNVGGGFNLSLLSRRWMSLRLRVPGGHGDERQGDGGMRGGLFLRMALFSNGAELTRASKTFSAVRVANVGLDISAIDLEAGNHSTYKRTMDFVKTEPINTDTWQTTLNNVRQIRGLQLPLPDDMTHDDLARLDVSQPAGRETMHGLLERWIDKLQAMEAAVAQAEVPGVQLNAREQDLLAQANQVDEVKASSFMLLAERMLLQSKLAQQDIPMLQASARIELNIPFVDPTSKDVTSHVRLGAVIKQARKVEQALPELQKVKEAYAKLPGYNEARLVFDLDQRVVNLANRLIAVGVPRSEWAQMGLPAPKDMPADATHIKFTADDAKDMLLRNHSVYRMVVFAAKNNEANVMTNSIPVGITMRDEAILSEERFLAETQIKMGWNGRVVRAEMLPTAQHALSDDVQGLRSFARADVHATVPAAPVEGHHQVVLRPAGEAFVPERPGARPIPPLASIPEGSEMASTSA